MRIVRAEYGGGPALAVHGGAGAWQPGSPPGPAYAAGIRAALAAGREVLDRSGAAIDAALAAVEVLELDPLFNAGRGATLTAAGAAELDAAVMRGDGRAGAVAASRAARSPVRLARAVLERSDHVLLVDPPADLVREWGLDVAAADWFVTDHRRAQLARALAARAGAGPAAESPSPSDRHGTVGAVALDSAGRLAAATSTGGMVATATGRVGDSPVIGAGTYAEDGVVAVSNTGVGEAYLESVAAYDIAARMKYAQQPLTDAIEALYASAIAPRDADGGTIALTPGGEIVLAWSSELMHGGYWTPDAEHVLG